MTLKPCWVCDSKDIAYTDILGMTWCEDCMDRIYWADEDSA